MFAYLVYIQYFSPRPPAKTLSSIKQVSQFENHQARSGIEVTGLKISWQVSDFIFTWLAESWKAAMVMYGSHGFLIHCKMQLLSQISLELSKYKKHIISLTGKHIQEQ